MAYTPDPTDVTNPLDTVDASTAAAEFRALKGYLQTLVGGSGNPGFNVFRKNAIIGGDFDTNPWQRGTNFVTVLTNTLTADRFKFLRINAGTLTLDVTRTLDAPTLGTVYKNRTMDLFVRNCFQANITATTGVGATDLAAFLHRVEGYNWKLLAQIPIVLSFWHKHTKVGTYCVALNNVGPDRYFIAEYQQVVSDTWEYDQIVIPASPSAGTWDYTSSIGIEIAWTLLAGATFQAAANAWTAGGAFYATANQVNAGDTIGNKFRLANIQLEAGSFSTKFERRSIQEELILCQRYYWKTFPIATAPAQNTAVTQGALSYIVTVAAANRNGICVKFPVLMRAVPVITTYNPSAANANWRNLNLPADSGVPAFANAGDSEELVINPQVAGDALTNICAIHLGVDAEL